MEWKLAGQPEGCRHRSVTFSSIKIADSFWVSTLGNHGGRHPCRKDIRRQLARTFTPGLLAKTSIFYRSTDSQNHMSPKDKIGSKPALILTRFLRGSNRRRRIQKKTDWIEIEWFLRRPSTTIANRARPNATKSCSEFVGNISDEFVGVAKAAA